MTKKLIKIYRDNAVFLIDNSQIITEKIPAESAEILEFYNKNKIFSI